jgi:hypothetical protein
MIAVMAVMAIILGLIVTTVIWGMTRDIDEDDGKATCRIGCAAWWAGCFWLGVSLIFHRVARAAYTIHKALDLVEKWWQAHTGGWIELIGLWAISLAYLITIGAARIALSLTTRCQEQAMMCAVEGGAEA